MANGLPQHYELFAQAIANGKTAAGAYLQHIAAEGTTYATCCDGGSRLLQKPEVYSRVEELRVDFKTFMEKKMGVKREQMAEYLLNIIHTPPDEITASSPICQGIVPKAYGTELKIPSKLEAAKLLNAMGGFNAPVDVAVHSTHEDIEATLEEMFGETKKVNKQKRGKGRKS